MSWRDAGHWIDEKPEERQEVAANCVRALRRDAMKSADAGLVDRAFSDVSVAIRILVNCEPRHSLESWVAWSELEREVLRELEDISSRYPLEDRFLQWYELALAKCPQPGSRKFAALILRGEIGSELPEWKDWPWESLLEPRAQTVAEQSSPGTRLLNFFEGFGRLVPVGELEERIVVAKRLSKQSDPFAGLAMSVPENKDKADLRNLLARAQINCSFRDVAINALHIKRVGFSEATQGLAQLENRYGFKARLEVEGERESLQVSRLSDSGELVRLEWLLRH
jgi:hypothetical protein